jgi:hypothetical protein
VSWRNKGAVEMNLDHFKRKFGCNSKGYSRFKNLKTYVLDPAITEINEKTDLNITYKLLGDNLTGIRPRVTGLQFFITEKVKQKELTQPTQAEKTVFEYIKTPPQSTIPIAQEPQNDYLTDILRVFLLFEPQSTAENVNGFLSAFDNQKSVLEACLYAEQERIKGHEIKNFRGYLVAGIPKGLGAGLLEQKNKEQKKKQEIEQKKKAERDRVLQLESLIKQADAVREAYRKAINDVLKNTATDADKENVADILRAQSSIYANRRLEDFRKPMFISTYITKFIETYPKRFEKVQNEYTLKFEEKMSEVKKLDPSKYKVLFY